ncbi:MAG: DUF3822 family protein [Algoriphagus aquaeductus]|uniref:DUF3822 family protein n=1 Tax=Algoriphagus TaxID=246875 RepID=UPI00258437E8|nr:DUF3822 family protein [Algoriphagus sp.]
MENNLKVYKSDKFDVEDTASLSLFLYPHTLFVFAKDKNNSNIAVHHHLKFDWNKMEEEFNSDPLLKIDVPAKIYVHEGLFNLIPGVLFQTGKEGDYLQLTGQVPENAHFFNSPLDSNNLQIVSFLSQKIKKNLDARFSENQIIHGASSFLSYLFKERFNLIGQEILVDYQQTHIYLAAFTDQDLSVFNRFEISSKEDMLKYILIMIETLRYDRNHVRINLFGVPEKSDINEAWGSLYFTHFRILKPHANQNYSHGFKHLKSEHIFETYWQYD